MLVENRPLGAVSGVELDRELKNLQGIWVGCGIRGTRYIGREGLLVVGKVSVLAGTRGKKARDPGEALFLRALSTDGVRVGAITDAYLEEETLAIPELTLSGGYFDDLLSPKTRIRQYAISEKGDVIVRMPEGGESE